MGEAKTRAANEAAADAEALERLLIEPVMRGDIMVGAACIAVLGDFWPRDLGPEGATREQQLQGYWAYMRRALRAPIVPCVWNRIRCLTEAMAKDHDILRLFGGEEAGDGTIKYDIQDPLFLRVCSTMPLMLNKAGAASVTCNVFVPYDVIKSLAAGPT